MHSESDRDGLKIESFTGRDILYREGAVGLLDVQRAADALLRQGRKPSVAAIRKHLGGGSPNTITPLLAKYWEKLGSRLGDGPESLERVPEALARVTELLWRRALEEARERLKVFHSSDSTNAGVAELQEQVGKLSIALAEACAREGEQLTHLVALSKEREGLRAERVRLLALLRGSQALLHHQNARVSALERARIRKLKLPASGTSFARPRGAQSMTVKHPVRIAPRKRIPVARSRAKARKPK
jgi:Plasmid replication region DNA-binding N-term